MKLSKEALNNLAFEVMEPVSIEASAKHKRFSVGFDKDGFVRTGSVSLGRAASKAVNDANEVGTLEAILIEESQNKRFLEYMHNYFADELQFNQFIQSRESAEIVNYLTEINLPSYRADINSVIERNAPKELIAPNKLRLGQWVADESWHHQELSHLLVAHKVSDTIGFVEAVNRQNLIGSSENPDNIVEQKIYTSIQEILAGRAHRNTAELFGPIAHRLSMTIAAQEFNHATWFKNEASAIAQATCPELREYFMIELEKVVRNFIMPGADGIIGYDIHEQILSKSGVLRIDDQVEAINDCLRRWYPAEYFVMVDDAKMLILNVDKLEGLLSSAEAILAANRMNKRILAMSRMAKRAPRGEFFLDNHTKQMLGRVRTSI